MKIQMINPPSLYPSVEYGFSHLAVTEEGRLVHCAGQVAWDRDCNLVGQGDLSAQLRQAFCNINLALQAVDAGPSNVVRTRLYVVDYRPEYLPVIAEVTGEFYGGATPAPSTLIGVAALALPEFLVEVEATAVV